MSLRKTIGVCFCASVLVGMSGSFVRADVISLNIAADEIDQQIPGDPRSHVGSNTAGVVSVGGWNDVATVGGQTGMALKNSTGATVPGLTLACGAYTWPSAAYDAAGTVFANAGDKAMMRSFAYVAGGNLDMTFTGTVPWSKSDVYVYYNGGDQATHQTVSILDGNGNTLVSRAVNNPGRQGNEISAYVSDAVSLTNSNYVEFANVAMPTNFTIRAGAASGQYAILNGIQIVEHAVPEPTTAALLLTGLLGLLAYAWRTRK